MKVLPGLGVSDADQGRFGAGGGTLCAESTRADCGSGAQTERGPLFHATPTYNKG